VIQFYRRCIEIAAVDSPNVALALWEQEHGLPVSNTVVVPGQITWAEYQYRRATFTAQQRCESLDARWYDGPEERLVPDEWLRFANTAALTVNPRRGGRRWMGVDPGEGGDDSAWVVVDGSGVLDVTSLKTPDTNSVYGRTCLMAREWGIAWEDVVFDYGGGGKEHVDRLRAGGFNARGVRFGAIKREVKRAMTQFTERREVEEETAGYTNRRSAMAWDVRMLLERPAPLTPDVADAVAKVGGAKVKQTDKPPFALPLPMCDELCRQLRAVPLTWDDQGRFRLIPKNPPAVRPDDPNCFRNRIGRSPDQFDAFCLAVYGMRNPPIRAEAGVS
jgi:hypothetical protein